MRIELVAKKKEEDEKTKKGLETFLSREPKAATNLALQGYVYRRARNAGLFQNLSWSKYFIRLEVRLCCFFHRSDANNLLL